MESRSPTPEVYRRYVEDSSGYPKELVDSMEDTARFLSSRIHYFFIFNSISSIVRNECLSMEYEHTGDSSKARLARLSAIDEQRVVRDTLLGDERLQNWYREVEGRVSGLLALSREVMPDHFFKNAPSLLSYVRVWADVHVQA